MLSQPSEHTSGLLTSATDDGKSGRPNAQHDVADAHSGPPSLNVVIAKSGPPSLSIVAMPRYGGSGIGATGASITKYDPNSELPPLPNMFGCRFLGMYMSYLCVGFIYGAALAIVYPVLVILHGEPNNYQQAVAGCFTLFWSFKVFYGFLTDRVPILGYRRKPYLLLGWSIAISASTILAVTATINGEEVICKDASLQDQVPCDTPGAKRLTVTVLSTGSLVLWMVVNNFGYVMADVAMDSMAIEYAKREAPEQRGAIQGFCYASRAAGFVVSTAITGFGLNGPNYGGSFSFELSLRDFLWILVGLQAVGMPWWLALKEDKVDISKVEAEVSLSGAWQVLRNTTFSKLMIFNVIMNMSQAVIVNARMSVLNLWVGMSPLCNAVDSEIGQIITMVVLILAAVWLKRYNWRGLLAFGTTYYIAFMFAFWLVVFDVVRNQWFVVFIDADQTLAQTVGYLVVMWACVEMAPSGMEGTTLALATTVGNAGQSLGNYVVMAYNAIFDLSRDQLEKDDSHVRHEYMFNSIAVILTQCFFILFIFWMPTSGKDAREKFEKKNMSTAWAVVASCMVVFAMTWGAGTTVAAVFCPCASILGGDGCENGCSSS